MRRDKTCCVEVYRCDIEINTVEIHLIVFELVSVHCHFLSNLGIRYVQLLIKVLLRQKERQAEKYTEF